MDKEFSLSSKEIELAITVKWGQICFEELRSLTYDQVKRSIFGLYWKRKQPSSLSEAMNDILRINASDVVSYLAHEAIEVGSSLNLEECKAFVGGLE